MLPFDLVLIDLAYMAYPDACRHKITFLLRLRLYPLSGDWLLCNHATFGMYPWYRDPLISAFNTTKILL